MKNMKPNYPYIHAHSATTTAAVILDSNPKRKAVIIYNNGAETVYLGFNSSVSTSNGLPILSGAAYENDHFNATGEYWIISTGTTDLRVEEDLSTSEGM
jgi:hypothetical protein